MLNLKTLNIKHSTLNQSVWDLFGIWDFKMMSPLEVKTKNKKSPPKLP